VARGGRHEKGEPFRFRHGWIPVGGKAPSGEPRTRHELPHAGPERIGPPDESQLTSLTHAGLRGKEPYGGRGGMFGEGGKGKQPFGGLFGPRPGEHQPLSDQEYEQHTHKIEQALKDAVAAGESTDSKYGIDVPAGVWQPERAKMHEQIANDIYGRQATTAKSTGDAMILGGLGGAGKSTVLKNNLGADMKDWVVVNPDDVKEEMIRHGMIPDVPGLSPLEASALVHEESGHIANLVAARAMADRKNLIYDITMSGKGSVQKRLDKLKAAGYNKPQGVFVDIPVEKSVESALARHRRGLEEHRQGIGHGGRYVPPAVIRQAGASETHNSINRDVFDSLAGQFGSRRLFDRSGGGDAVEVPLSGQQGETSIANAANRKALGS
jgi:predicted ABC-type ATPase